MYCPKCGAKNEEGAKYCAKCGSIIDPQQAPDKTTHIEAAESSDTGKVKSSVESIKNNQNRIIAMVVPVSVFLTQLFFSLQSVGKAVKCLSGYGLFNAIIGSVLFSACAIAVCFLMLQALKAAMLFPDRGQSEVGQATADNTIIAPLISTIIVEIMIIAYPMIIEKTARSGLALMLETVTAFYRIPAIVCSCLCLMQVLIIMRNKNKHNLTN